MFQFSNLIGKSMKKYSVYLKIEAWDENLDKQFEILKKKFLKEFAASISDKKISITKIQDVPLAVNLSVNEKHHDEILEMFRKSDVVATIDAEYIMLEN